MIYSKNKDWNDLHEIEDRLTNLNNSYYSKSNIAQRSKKKVLNNHMHKENHTLIPDISRKEVLRCAREKKEAIAYHIRAMKAHGKKPYLSRIK